MALYLGNIKQKIILDGEAYNLIIPSFQTKNIKLLSSDNFILQDSNGIYLTTKEAE